MGFYKMSGCVQKLVKAGSPCAAILGKTWKLFFDGGQTTSLIIYSEVSKLVIMGTAEVVKCLSGKEVSNCCLNSHPALN